MRPAFAAALAAAAFAGPAIAEPALPVMVIAVERAGAPADAVGRIDALVAALGEDGRLAVSLPDLPTKRVQNCGRSPTWEGCIRRWLQKKRLNSIPVRLAVVADRRAGGEVRLTCIGPGRRWTHTPAHVAWIDLDRALAEPADGPYRARFVACLRAAFHDRGF